MIIAPIIIAYLLMLLFFIVERKLRQGQEAKSWETTSADRRSTRYVGVAFGISLVLILFAPLLNTLHVGQIIWYSSLVSWIGVVIAALGFFLRVWATHVLGAFYTRTLRTVEKHHVVQTGPYRVVRHPGYLGMVILWIGESLAVQNWIVLVILVIVEVSAYVYRIQAEEILLSQSFGKAYTSYQTKTWKIVPLFY